MPYTASPQDTEEPSPREKEELRSILRCLRVVRSNGGFGTLSIWIKGGELYEIQTAYSEKPKNKTPG